MLRIGRLEAWVREASRSNSWRMYLKKFSCDHRENRALATCAMGSCGQVVISAGCRRLIQLCLEAAPVEGENVSQGHLHFLHARPRSVVNFMMMLEKVPVSKISRRDIGNGSAQQAVLQEPGFLSVD